MHSRSASLLALRYVNLQDWGYKTFHFAHQQAIVDQDASLQWTIAALGGRLAKVNQRVNLVGPGANCQVNGVLFPGGGQNLDGSQLLHVAQSLYHDHVPATAMGLATAWIDRRHDRQGFGATAQPDGDYRLDFTFTSMADLVSAHRAEN